MLKHDSNGPFSHFQVRNLKVNFSREHFCTWETTENITFEFPIAPTENEKQSLLHFHDFPKENNIEKNELRQAEERKMSNLQSLPQQLY